jgi:hypothetical protein
MANGKQWDLTSTHSLEAAAEWLRVRSDALIVVVIRPGDGALAADPLIDVIDFLYIRALIASAAGDK